MRRLWAAAALCLSLCPSVFAQSPAEYRVPRAAAPPKLDGILDDQVWTQGPMPTGQWVSYNPNRGDKMPDVYKTDVRVAYDDRNIYFAFHCFDHEPEKIRTNIAKRDAAFSDDWIAISLDSAGTGQAAYHLFSNPSASQMDALNTSASGEQFDADMVWFSAAKKTADGYVVEVQIPLQTLRFSGGDDVKMNLVFFRKVSRIGYSYAWPEMLPGQWVFDRPSRLVFSNLKPRRLVELLPSITYGINQQRDGDTWGPSDDKFNLGASGKIGLTSGITLDGTINPDFSQVESDAFQVQVNQRFPLFFSEKRPFFMEGMGLFNIAGTAGDGNMRTAVHTRRIVDPIYGSKLTGTIGKTAFGVLNAVDDSPTAPFTIEGEPIDVPNKVTTVGRATYGLQRSDYVGGIFAHTQHAGRHNVVAGGDQSRTVSEGVLPAAILNGAEPRGFRAWRLAERVHRNRHVFHVDDLEFLGLRRRTHHHAVARRRLHQRAPQRRHPADIAAGQVDFVDADDPDDVLLAGGVFVRDGRPEEHARSRGSRPRRRGIDDFGRIDALPQKTDARIDLAQPPLAVKVVGVFAAVAVGGRPRHDLGHCRPFPVQQELMLVFQPLQPGGRDVVLRSRSRRLAHGLPQRSLRSHAQRRLHRLFLTQGDHGIHARRATRGHIARQQDDNKGETRRARKTARGVRKVPGPSFQHRVHKPSPCNWRTLELLDAPAGSLLQRTTRLCWGL